MLDYEDFFAEAKIPQLTRTGIDSFIQRGTLPGSFVCSVLENNLKQAYGNADDFNIVAIPSIVHYLYNNAPGICWGSPREVREWIEIGGMEGYQRGARPREGFEEDED